MPEQKYPTIMLRHELASLARLRQRREAARQDLRSGIDFGTSVLSEVWLEAVAGQRSAAG